MLIFSLLLAIAFQLLVHFRNRFHWQCEAVSSVNTQIAVSNTPMIIVLLKVFVGNPQYISAAR
ncbi:hypothetical protein [Nostoc sp. DSM 114160]